MNKNLKFIIIILFSLFVFFVFFKGLEKPNNYLPEKNLNKIETGLVFKNLYDQKEILLGELINNEVVIKKYIGPLDEMKFKEIIEIIKNEKN